VPADIDLELPVDRNDTVQLTDWVEAYMLVTEADQLSEEDIRELLRIQTEGISDLTAAGFGDPDELDELEVPTLGEDAARTQAELILSEIARRERRALRGCASRTVYPFARTAVGIELNRGDNSILYEFLLWLSLTNAPFRRETYGSKVTRFFDLLGQAVLVAYLAQCTVSQSAFVQKLADVKERLWSAFLGLGQPPVTAMLVPFDVSSADEWKWSEFHYAVGIVVDRPRIVELLCLIKPEDIHDFKRIAAWTRQKRRALTV
jgi:hypothetical protein